MNVFRFVRRRVIRLVLTVFVIASIVFFLVRVLPGDPAAVIAGLDSDPGSLEAIRVRMGIDEPLVVQYLGWLWRAIRFDFGDSFFTGESAMRMILARFPLTLLLATMSFVFALAVAIPIGVLSAVHRWGPIDYLGMIYSQIGMAVPGFWLGIILLLLLSVRMPVFPLFGADSLRHLVLPMTALGLGRSALLVRYVRSSTLAELGSEYVVTAESMGVRRTSVRYRHVLKNALLPVITIAGIQYGYMRGGTIIIEQVFSLPGGGRLLLSSIQQRDFAVIQAGVVFVAVIFSSINFVADVLYSVVNPRIRVG